MKVPVRWLRELVPTDLSGREIAQRMTLAGLEAESITSIGAEWDRVYVGYVAQVERHPDADRLVLATVEAGEHALTVVTGAPNIQQGQKVALALTGARLVDPYVETLQYKTLKASSIRGVRSEGMVCSEKELGISEEHEGILILPEDAPAGVPLQEYLGDEVIEFEITPNLVHAFSIVGIARELGAILDVPVKMPEMADLSAIERRDETVTIEANDLCSRYAVAMIEGVKLGTSPEWMQRRLTHAGMRPINTIVDISNYVMLEIGQPTHPFNADAVTDAHIIVRRAQAGERFETLDHVVRTMEPDTLMIADREHAIGLAGVMGGVDSEITDGTTRVLFESASFLWKSVRTTARGQRLPSEAAARFGRGVDPNLAWAALERSVALLAEIEPDAKVTYIADVYPQPRTASQVTMPYGELERLLGMQIPLETAVGILTRLDLRPEVTEVDEAPAIVVNVPTWRADITQSADVVEEVARIYGYDHLPERLPEGMAVRVDRSPERLVDDVVQDALIAAGLYQAITYSMTNDADLRALSVSGEEIPDVLGGFPASEAAYVRAVNPLRSDWELMRPTILPPLLRVVGENLKYGERVALFETARTYQPQGVDQLPDERRAVAIAMAGVRAEATWFGGDSTEIDFFDVRGAVEVLLQRLGATEATFTKVAHPSLHPGRAAAVILDGVRIGVLGEVHPSVAARFGITTRLAVAEIDLEPFGSRLLETWSAQPVPRHQAVRQDFAFIVKDEVPAAEVQAAIAQAAGALGGEIRLFDIYSGTGVPEGHRSLAFSVALQAPDRQVAEHEVERIRGRIESNVKKRTGGSLRA